MAEQQQQWSSGIALDFGSNLVGLTDQQFMRAGAIDLGALHGYDVRVEGTINLATTGIANANENMQLWVAGSTGGPVATGIYGGLDTETALTTSGILSTGQEYTDNIDFVRNIAISLTNSVTSRINIPILLGAFPTLPRFLIILIRNNTGTTIAASSTIALSYFQATGDVT